MIEINVINMFILGIILGLFIVLIAYLLTRL
jgi:cell division protein FtsB